MNWDAQILDRLKELRKKLLWLKLSAGFFRLLSASGLLFLGVLLLEMIFYFDPEKRIILAISSIFCLLGFISFWILHPIIVSIIKPIPSEHLALLWGYSIPNMNDRLLNALQVYESRKGESTSPELAELALSQVAEELKDQDYQGALDRKLVKKGRRILLWVAGIWILFTFSFRSEMSGALMRMAHPGKNFRQPPPYSFSLDNIPDLGIRGEPFTISVEGSGELPEKVTVGVLEGEAELRQYSADFDSNGQAVYVLSNPQEDLRITASWKEVISDTARVRIKTRPFIKEIQVRWIPPKYSKLPGGSSAGKRGDVSALMGSKVKIEITADRDLQAAEFQLFSDSKSENPEIIEMNVVHEKADGEFILSERGHYNIILTDFDDIQNAAPVDYSLWPIHDEMPTLSIIYPPAEAELNERLLIPLKAGGRDDFAITRIRIGYQLLKGEQSADSVIIEKFSWEKLPFQSLGEGMVIVDHLWDLNGLNLLPGDCILYKLDALDNDLVSGPKRVETPVQQLIFPTLEEIFARMEEGQKAQEETVQDVFDRSQLLKEDLKALSEELKKNPDLPWQERKKVEEMLKKQQEMTEQIQQMAQRMEELVQKMEENLLFSPETMAKFQQYQKLLEEVMTPELQAAIQKLQEALKQQDPEQLRQAVEEFSFNQEKFLAKMDKAMNILKQLQMEMKLDELVKRAEDILKKQQDVNKALQDSNANKSLEDEAMAESRLKNDMENFESEFQKAQEMLAESPNNPEEEMSAAAEHLKENQFPANMQNMSQKLQQGQLSSAEQKGQQLESGLAQLSEMMRQAKEQMISYGKRKLAQALKKISHDLLTLSYQQEELLNTSSELDRASPQFRKLAQEQQSLKNHLERTAGELMKLSQESFFITPQIGSAISRAFNGMEQAVSGYTARAPRSVSQQQQGAMGGLNQAIMEIGQSLDQLSSSSSSTGFSEMMEQLSQMAGQQGQINEGTMSLMPGGSNPGQFSLQQQAAMSRLAAEQEALRQQMESFSQGNQEISKMLGRLDELAKEMQEAANDLKNRQVSERTLIRQERILRRLLDAQKSVREREYRKERLSRTALEPHLKSSPENIELNYSPDKIKEMLLQALKEGYTRDYQQLIRDYFEALAREQ